MFRMFELSKFFSRSTIYVTWWSTILCRLFCSSLC